MDDHSATFTAFEPTPGGSQPTPPTPEQLELAGVEKQMEETEAIAYRLLMHIQKSQNDHAVVQKRLAELSQHKIDLSKKLGVEPSQPLYFF